MLLYNKKKDGSSVVSHEQQENGRKAGFKNHSNMENFMTA